MSDIVEYPDGYPVHVMTWGVGGHDPDHPTGNLLEDKWVDQFGNEVPDPNLPHVEHRKKEVDTSDHAVTETKKGGAR